ncbi:MAG: hypothetical protein Q8R57_16475 [Bacteroidota bacterium]|nr:hypothetical protein [Bacteroidota bacterium]
MKATKEIISTMKVPKFMLRENLATNFKIIIESGCAIFSYQSGLLVSS